MVGSSSASSGKGETVKDDAEGEVYRDSLQGQHRAQQALLGRGGRETRPGRESKRMTIASSRHRKHSAPETRLMAGYLLCNAQA